MFGQKPLMQRAVDLPKDEASGAQPLGCHTAVEHIWIPHHHFVQRDSHVVRSIATQVLVGKEEDFRSFGKGPLERAGSIRRGADRPSPFATECLNGGAGIHVGNRSDTLALIAGYASSNQLL